MKETLRELKLRVHEKNNYLIKTSRDKIINCLYFSVMFPGNIYDIIVELNGPKTSNVIIRCKIDSFCIQNGLFTQKKLGRGSDAGLIELNIIGLK